MAKLRYKATIQGKDQSMLNIEQSSEDPDALVVRIDPIGVGETPASTIISKQTWLRLLSQFADDLADEFYS